MAVILSQKESVTVKSLQNSSVAATPAGVLKPGGVLDQIIAARCARMASARTTAGAGTESDVPRDGRAKRSSLARALSRETSTNVIAEMKSRSPSKGVLRREFDPVAIADAYVKAGAAALSILTEEDFFGGSLDHLRAVRAGTALPILRKDFLFTRSDIEESVAAGADAVLLITAILDDDLLENLIQAASEFGIDPLVEVHSSDELTRAIRANARLIGVNNRDLRTFSVDLRTSLRLAGEAPANVALVAESGISTAEDVRRLRSAGFDGFLIGEHFMRSDDPGQALSRLLDELDLRRGE
jgi:indole-3-glycerol phosphate synthase